MSISARDLGEEIGVTGATISNILSGRIIKPQGETCKKLLGYCQQYGIDTSELDWNEIIHLYFISSKYAREYDWVSDVDEFGTLKLRHKRCGRITTVPIMGLDGASNNLITAHRIGLDNMDTSNNQKNEVSNL